MTDEWEFAGTVGVDSGHVLIGDPAYAADLNYDWRKRADFEGDAVRVSFGLAGGVVVPSGLGDGCYRVFIKRGTIAGREGERVTHMMIDFTESDYDG